VSQEETLGFMERNDSEDDFCSSGKHLPVGRQSFPRPSTANLILKHLNQEQQLM